MAKTLKEIADELKVSPSTISRVVNKKSYVNEETRKRVLEALKSNNYMPNLLARSLKIQLTKTIGIVIPDVCERFFGQIIKGVDEIVSKEGYSIILVDTNESKEKEEQYLDLLLQQRIAGLVIATVDTSGTKVLDFLDNNIPVVFIDNLPNIERQYNAVLIDNILASRYAVSHLISKGHKDIGIIIGSPNETTGYDRLLGYRLAMSDAGIQVNENLIMYGNYKEDSGYQCMERLIANIKENPLSAVIVTSEMMSYGAVKAVKNNNMKFPDDIAFIGFDIHDKTGLVHPKLSTIRQPEQQIGRLTAETLLKYLKENGEQRKNAQGHKSLLEPFLEIHESC